MLKTVRRWWRSRSVVHRLSAAQRFADRWLDESAGLLQALDAESAYLARLDGMQHDLSEQLRTAVEEHAATLQSCERLIRQHETVVEALRSENKILGEVEVAGLNAACQRFIELWHRERAVEVMQQVAVETSGREER